MSDPANTTQVYGVLIPVIAVFMGCAIPIVAIYCDYRKRKDVFEMVHKERIAAIEKGVPVPPLPDSIARGVFGKQEDPNRRPARPEDFLLHGLIWLLAGLPLTAALYMLLGVKLALFGLIPTGVGVALLLYYAMQSKKTRPAEMVAKTSNAGDPQQIG